MDRIDLLDSGFLYLETREAPMHVASLNLFEFPPRVNQRKFMARLDAAYRSTTELRKPFAHRVAHGALGRFGPLYWEADPDIDLDYHIQRSALPKPGRYRELFALVSRLHSTLLDRSRPLWEAHLIEGIKDRQFAVYTKAHHATIDGCCPETPDQHTVGSIHAVDITIRCTKIQATLVPGRWCIAPRAARPPARPRSP